MHYQRQWKTGNVGPAQPLLTPTRNPDPICTVEDCTRPHYARAYCRVHYNRIMRHGDVSVVKRPGWVGDDVTYKGVHRRLTRTRGKASGQTCAHCQAAAKHWAYDHTDDAERISPLGYLFSLDLTRYIPLCYLCHKRFDLQWRGRTGDRSSSR